MTAPNFAPIRYPDFGAVATFPVWGPTLASAFERACTGVDIALDVNGIVGEPMPTLHWCPATRRVRLWGVAQIPVDMVPGGVPVGSALIEVFQVPAEFCSPIKRLGAAPTNGGWVRWDLTPPAAANSPGSFGIRELPPAAFPTAHLGGVLQFASITLTGITWRVPRT